MAANPRGEKTTVPWGAITAPQAGRRLGRVFAARLSPYVLVLPALLLIGLLLAALASLFLESLREPDGAALGLAQYRLLAADPTYRGYFTTSLRIAFLATLGCLIFGYPVAYYMETTRRSVRHAIVMFLVLLFFSDYVMRVYALILLMGNNGLVNRTLLWLGIVRSPVRLMYSETGVVIGLILGNIPFMIFAISSVLSRIDRRLLQAAALLGATRSAALLRIVLPLSMPGVVSGSIIVFLLSMNSYLTPALLGGGFVQMIANFVYDQAISLWNMPLAAAAATILLVTAFALIALLNAGFERLGRRVGITDGRR
jgi:putative spermidine/putrescine transport system permease protein